MSSLSPTNSILISIQALQNTKYQSKEAQKAALPTLRETSFPLQAIILIFSSVLAVKKIGVTSTSELYEWATKKGFLNISVNILFVQHWIFSRGVCGF